LLFLGSGSQACRPVGRGDSTHRRTRVREARRAPARKLASEWDRHSSPQPRMAAGIALAPRRRPSCAGARRRGASCRCARGPESSPRGVAGSHSAGDWRKSRSAAGKWENSWLSSGFGDISGMSPTPARKRLPVPGVGCDPLESEDQHRGLSKSHAGPRPPGQRAVGSALSSQARMAPRSRRAPRRGCRGEFRSLGGVAAAQAARLGSAGRELTLSALLRGFETRPGQSGVGGRKAGELPGATLPSRFAAADSIGAGGPASTIFNASGPTRGRPPTGGHRTQHADGRRPRTASLSAFAHRSSTSRITAVLTTRGPLLPRQGPDEGGRRPSRWSWSARPHSAFCEPGWDQWGVPRGSPAGLTAFRGGARGG